MEMRNTWKQGRNFNIKKTNLMQKASGEQRQEEYPISFHIVDGIMKQI